MIMAAQVPTTRIPTGGVVKTEAPGLLTVEGLESNRSMSVPSVEGSPGAIYQPGFEQEVRLLKKAKAQVASRNERIHVKEEEIKRLGEEVESLKAVETEVHGLCNQMKNLETLMEAEDDMKKAIEAKNAELVMGKERIHATFEEFKKYEDDRVEKHCIEMDARLDVLSIDFDEEFSSQLTIPVYPKVHNHEDPWAFKEEILLGDAIAANISHTEKKKKCRVVCRTQGISFAYHARSDGVLVSVPTVAPHGLAILLADATTQTTISEYEASPKQLRSKSLPPFYNLDWP
ncbi:hypothetical protein Tco_0267520 [Tanacetum coccineum]